MSEPTIVIQRLMFPDAAVNDEPKLFHHHWGEVDCNRNALYYEVCPSATLRFDAYYNVLAAHLYEFGEDNQLFIRLRAEGEFRIRVLLASTERRTECLHQATFNASPQKDALIALPRRPLNGLLFLEIVAITLTRLHAADYCVSGPARHEATVTGVITTFMRDAAVQGTGRRLQQYFDANPDLRPFFKLLVIDNGGDTDSVPFDQGRVIKNKNLGGAGGFTRGLTEVVDNKLSSHALFMDDDASFFPESLRRSIGVLRFAPEASLAIGGAMIAESNKWRMWENTAIFSDMRCQPIHKGLDLRLFHDVMAASLTAPASNPKNKYAGWWYFCFPVDRVKVWPFPFFVRGDDSYFSLSNDFDIVTMPGVSSIQEDFSTKASPLVIYLDMRYHIVHHLTFERLHMNTWQLLSKVMRYFMRQNNSYHYDSAAAINLAIADVMNGTEFWNDNADMSTRRQTIAAMTLHEKIQPDLDYDPGDLATHSPKRHRGWVWILLRWLTFNGHLLPERYFARKGVRFTLHHRSIEHDTFRRKYTVTVDAETGNRGYILSLDRGRYFRNLFTFLKLAVRLAMERKRLQRQYAEARTTLTAKDAWARRFA